METLNYWRSLIETGQKDARIIVLDADCSLSTKTARFGERFPERFYNVGIAEQNLVGVAAGFAAMGFLPFANTFASFLTRRALDQIALSVVWPRLNVKLVGHFSGLRSLARDGASHQALGDIASMRSLGNISIFCPADQSQAGEAVCLAVNTEGPVYIRLHRALPKTLLPPGELKPGYMPVVQKGGDITLVVTGEMLETALEAAHILESQGIFPEVLAATSIQPFDIEKLCASASRTKRVVTIEEHFTSGGLGSLVAELLTQHCPVHLCRIGVDAAFGQSSLDDRAIMHAYHLSAEQIVNRILNWMKR